MTEIAKQQAQPLDNFASYDDSVETTDRESNRGLARLVGDLLKFTNEAKWETADGADYSGRQLVAANVRRTEVKWGDGAPVEVIELRPDAKYRDLTAVNEDLPKSEWREGPDGKLHGPWVRQHVLELVNPDALDRFSWPTSTVGGSIAIRELVERIQLMRRFRGENVYPLVVLSHKHMNTRFGGRERPHLEIKSWVRIGETGIETVGTDPRPQLQHGAAAPGLQPVTEPSLREEMRDDVPWK